MRLFALVITAISHSILLNPRSGPLHFMLWLPKLLADALSPLLVVWHLLVGLTGLKRRDWLLVLIGGMGTAVSLKHFTDTTTPQENEIDVLKLTRDWVRSLSRDVVARHFIALVTELSTVSKIHRSTIPIKPRPRNNQVRNG